LLCRSALSFCTLTVTVRRQSADTTLHDLGEIMSLSMALAIAGLATPFLLLARRRRALTQPVATIREPTEHECHVLRRRGRLSVTVFVLFWFTSVSLILAASLFNASEGIELIVLFVIFLMAAGGIAFQLGTRCRFANIASGIREVLACPPDASDVASIFDRSRSFIDARRSARRFETEIWITSRDSRSRPAARASYDDHELRFPRLTFHQPERHRECQRSKEPDVDQDLVHDPANSFAGRVVPTAPNSRPPGLKCR
jgi:hypothetical protein